MYRLFPRYWLLVLICGLGLASPAWGENVETALMPGQVIAGHAKWEEDCNKCHKRFDKSAQTTLCLDCHNDVRTDIAQQQGFHGRLTDQRPCKACHTDHKGRTENIAPITEATFDHTKTDFPLRGTHADTKKTDCKSCHKPKTKYREAPSACYSCHKKDDQHRGNLGTACADCHTDRTWKEVRFDHDKTRYKLRNKHISVPCKDCHANERYKNTPIDCYACHKKDDTHKGQEGIRCEECHDDRSWKKAPFDHNKSRFPLLGKHAAVECKRCHLTPAFKEAPSDCYACHKKDDTHKGSYGERCDTCHGASDWKSVTFDHELHSKYPLRGRHITARCQSCHKGSLYTDKTPVDCYACHKSDDPHTSRYSDSCERCHTERRWNILLFDHDRDTPYVLKEAHRRAKCDGCHKTPLYRDKTSTRCVACHKKDDIHQSNFGEKCETCHGERAWAVIAFNHDRDTIYPLLGKHRIVSCESCHTSPLYKEKTPTVCYACHKSDDTHRRKLGTLCQDCHNTRDWKIWDFNHDTRTRFKLDGGHRDLSCYACHAAKMDTKVVAPTSCIGCHKKDDKHDGGFGTQCDRCHETGVWNRIKAGAGGLRGPSR